MMITPKIDINTQSIYILNIFFFSSRRGTCSCLFRLDTSSPQWGQAFGGLVLSLGGRGRRWCVPQPAPQWGRGGCWWASLQSWWSCRWITAARLQRRLSSWPLDCGVEHLQRRLSSWPLADGELLSLGGVHLLGGRSSSKVVLASACPGLLSPFSVEGNSWLRV